MEDIVRKGKSICIWGDAVHDDFLRKNYPTFSKSDKVVRKRGLFSVMEGLKNDDCDVAVTGKTYFDTSKNNEYLNKDCTFTWVGEYVQSIPAGMATAIDTGTYCTSLISYVLDLHMNEMKIEGGSGEESAYEKIMDSFSMNKENTTEVCNVPGSKMRNSNDLLGGESVSFGIADIGGISLVHAIASIISVSMAVGQYLLKRRKGNTGNKALGDIASRRSMWAPGNEALVDIASQRSILRQSMWSPLKQHQDPENGFDNSDPMRKNSSDFEGLQEIMSSASDSEECRQYDTKEGALLFKLEEVPKI